MACNCGKKRKAKPMTPAGNTGSGGKFVLTTASGSKLEFGSKLEADAANARAGYTGRVTRR